MKTKIFCGVAALALLGAFQAAAQIQYVTLHCVSNVVHYAVQTNQVITLVGYEWSARPSVIGYYPDGKTTGLHPYVKDTASYISSWPLGVQTFTGLTNVSVGWGVSPFGSATFKIETPATSSYIPANAVVIPTDATGPVQIILESSADLVNWTSALPGTYGTSTTNRFFRVRAVANQ